MSLQELPIAERNFLLHLKFYRDQFSRSKSDYYPRSTIPIFPALSRESAIILPVHLQSYGSSLHSMLNYEQEIAATLAVQRL